MTNTFIIENSAAPGAIGDTIASFPALKAMAWRSEKPINVYLSSKPCRPLLNFHNINQLEERPSEAKILDIQTFAHKYMNTGQSMGQAYMAEIGLPEVAAQKVPELEIYLEDVPPSGQLAVYDVILAPFSNSDNGTNTKIWPIEKWELLYLFLRSRNYTVAVLGVESDITERWKTIGTHILDLPLSLVATMMDFSGLTISVDNGINWIAQAIKCPHLVLLPATANPGWTANRAQNAINMPIAIDVETVMGKAEEILNAQKPNGSR